MRPTIVAQINARHTRVKETNSSTARYAALGMRYFKWRNPFGSMSAGYGGNSHGRRLKRYNKTYVPGLIFSNRQNPIGE